ncbi:hypothetical protein Dsin_010531 [Dipteronia sinensis]|uniref:Uncharacterized protein n=1 Tax=Dipteronia sinensis TaxID=43782 RepID=A0AAE0ECR7_9ROSI|nr:hypothetical protein Dsin_010531 [Dipteronia sinensis]
METRNQERDRRFLKLEEDFLSYKIEMASQNAKIHYQLAKLNDRLTLGHNSVDLEGSKANGKLQEAQHEIQNSKVIPASMTSKEGVVWEEFIEAVVDRFLNEKQEVVVYEFHEGFKPPAPIIVTNPAKIQEALDDAKANSKKKNSLVSALERVECPCSSRRCPSVQVSHLFDSFEIGEFASGLAGGRPCLGTDPTPKQHHGSAPERVDRELTPFPHLNWVWSATKVHWFVEEEQLRIDEIWGSIWAFIEEEEDGSARWRFWWSFGHFGRIYEGFLQRIKERSRWFSEKRRIGIFLMETEEEDADLVKEEEVRDSNDLIWGLIEERIRDFRRGIGDFVSSDFDFWVAEEE